VLKGTLLRERFGTQAGHSGTIIWNYVFQDFASRALDDSGSVRLGPVSRDSIAFTWA